VVGILTEEMRRLVEEQRLGFVATVCPDGTPNLSPKGTVTVWDDDHLIFADICSPRTVANLRTNPAVEVNVVDPFARRGYRFKGTGAVLSDGPAYDDAVAFFRARGSRLPIRSVVLVAVTRALPVVSPAYADGTTETEVRARWEPHYRSLMRGEVRDHESDAATNPR
jgi:predicted pyridoxine 5'-phosphate oxidase superfamily flavin-nucleotide-binding protein